MVEAGWGQARSEAVLIERDGRFVVYQPGSALIASGESVEAAYRKFSDAKQAFLAEVERAGISTVAEEIGRREGGPSLVASRGIAGELGLFAAKTCIVLIFIFGIFGGLAVVAKQAIDRAVATLPAEFQQASGGVSDFFKSLGSVSMVDVANKAAVIVQDVRAMPEERKESLRQSVGTLSRELTPIVDAWRNPPPPQPK